MLAQPIIILKILISKTLSEFNMWQQQYPGDRRQDALSRNGRVNRRMNLPLI